MLLSLRVEKGFQGDSICFEALNNQIFGQSFYLMKMRTDYYNSAEYALVVVGGK